jgi:Fic family protein
MALGEVLYKQEQIECPLERAVYLHCNLARLQPFIDGNKRTSRMMESIVMMNAGIIPCYSSKDSDILAYRRGLVHFYETADYTQYADYFLNRLLQRLADIE